MYNKLQKIKMPHQYLNPGPSHRNPTLYLYTNLLTQLIAVFIHLYTIMYIYNIISALIGWALGQIIF